MGVKSVCVYRGSSTFSSNLDERVFLCSPQDAEKVRSVALGSSKSSTGTRPPHHSAARTTWCSLAWVGWVKAVAFLSILLNVVGLDGVQ